MITRTLSLVAALGIFAAASASAMTASSTHIGSVPVLLGVDKVRKELHINSLQKAVLDSLRDEYKAAAQKLSNPMPQTKADRDAAEAKLLALNTRYNNRALSVLNDTQRERFLEIEHQVLGATHLYSTKVQKKVGLTPEQVQQVEKIRQKGLVTVGKINHRFEDGKLDYQQRLEALHKARLINDAALLKLLTPAQRTTFDALGGKKVVATT